MQFYLGTHEPAWLKRTAVPLFVSARRLRRRKALPRALGPWALDSGGFSEISLYGGWKTPATQYSTEARIWATKVGGMRWAAVQDMMCEPHMIARTGLGVLEHQRQTVASVKLLRQLAPDLPWLPVVQGWTIADYLRCVDMHGEAGIDLREEPLVGLGSVCRREATTEIAELVHALCGRGLRLHGFGMKVGGLRRVGHLLASADSMAWSHKARREGFRFGCPERKEDGTPRHRVSCANCMDYALHWRQCVLAAVPAVGQRLLDLAHRGGSS